MSVRRRSFMSRDNTSHAWPKGKISCSICRPYQIEIDYGQNFNWLNTMKQRKITMCLLFHSSQIYYACPMDLLVTWGSNLAESSHHHSLANFSQSGFCQQLIAFGKVSIFFSQTDWVLVPLDIQQCSEDDLKSYTSNCGGECHRVGHCL